MRAVSESTICLSINPMRVRETLSIDGARDEYCDNP